MQYSEWHNCPNFFVHSNACCNYTILRTFRNHSHPLENTAILFVLYQHQKVTKPPETQQTCCFYIVYLTLIKSGIHHQSLREQDTYYAVQCLSAYPSCVRRRIVVGAILLWRIYRREWCARRSVLTVLSEAERNRIRTIKYTTAWCSHLRRF